LIYFASTKHNVIEDGFWEHLVGYSMKKFTGVPYITQASGKLDPSIVKEYA